MNTLRPLRSIRSARSWKWTCPSCTCTTRYVRMSSTETAPPALLSKLKGDLKSAMKARDTPRLNVLRAVISEVNNASKTSSPVTNDLQILAMLKKRKANSKAAQTEATEQNRADLADKQQAEIDVLDEYAGSVQVMTKEEIQEQLAGLVEQMKKAGDVKPGLVLKEVFKPGGVFHGKPVEKSLVAEVVNALVAG